MELIALRLSVKSLESQEKTGHKWKNRFWNLASPASRIRARAPSNSPNQLDEDTVIRLIKMRSAHPAWGPKKLAVLYKSAYPESPTPSESSIYRILGKAGLIPKRRFRHPDPTASKLRNKLEALQPNDVWTVDFKGWWMLPGGTLCSTDRP